MALARIVLTSGRTVDLSALHMSSTYGGLLEGYPCKLLNDRRIDALVRRAGRSFPGAPVHLIPPPREYPDQYAGAFGPVEVLPSVACVGSFHAEALDPSHERALYRSHLTVVWFQATPCVPSGHDAEPGLLDVPWDALATDEEL
ncbi:hypothetical protein SHKM778_92690 [Streptomyces sp. KM77-8]|uniref:Uncharacterized protein n=1 Tax=Streptomyces haneummycinicus TaxID=3074435 RepID=A0AAT9HZK2_9ACTN